MTEHPGREARFTHYLGELADRDDRAALAALRRGLGKKPGEAPEMFPYLVPWIGDLSGWPEETYYLVASLFALHPLPWTGGAASDSNLGGSLLRAAQGGREGIERRFVAMLNSRRDDLPEHLRHAVSLCRTQDVPVHWERLLHQIRGWDSESRWVQKQWARAFWGSLDREDDAATTAETRE